MDAWLQVFAPLAELVKAGCTNFGLICVPSSWIVCTRHSSLLVVSDLRHLFCTKRHRLHTGRRWCHHRTGLRGGPWEMRRIRKGLSHLLHLFCGFHLTEFSVFIHKAFLLSFKVLQ